MVDREARNRLAHLLFQLGTEEIDKDRCWRQARAPGRNACDQGILAVLLFLESIVLAEDDLTLLPLRRRRILPPETLRRLAVSVIFLSSDAEYEWPAFPQLQGGGADCLLLLACAYVCVFATFAAGSAVMLLLNHHYFWGTLAATPAPLCSWGVIKLMRLSSRWRAENAARWERETRQLGAFDVWPFRRLSDFENALRNPAVPETITNFLSSCSPPPCTA
ncbi:MAG TPA: hypothetical protein VKS79_23175 [Gemmataceae bacterium]|nr:hypothetical protein [Gemmataceae bacterium]